MHATKILSDFDGVWTDQQIEAEYVERFAIDALADVTGASRASVAADWAAFVAEVLAAPGEHGWAPDGRISAYVDEDPLCQGSAVCRLLASSDAPRAVRYREALAAAGQADLGAFSERCFHGGTAAFRRDHPPCIVPEARDQLQALVDAGAEIVVVSNSASEKLIAFFAAAGIHAVADDSGERGELRVRGGAGKWFLGPTNATIAVGGRSIFVDRPRYRAVLEDERPDIVIGDVFSLDLALPHVLRQAGSAGAPSRLVLRRHAHTPAWIAGDRAGGAIDGMVARPGDLADIVRGMSAAASRVDRA